MAASKPNTPFMSCIKVKGISLLPPFITPKRRVELQHYKQQAVKLEKRLKNCRDLQKNLEDLLNMEPLTDRRYSEVSFCGSSHVEALGIAEKANNDIPPPKRQITLSRDIIDVTQYNTDGIKIIYNDSNQDVGASEQVEVLYQHQHTNDVYQEPNSLNSASMDVNNHTLEGTPTKSFSSPLELSPRPRLIRSNSYTLDTPSPVLLAHLKKTGESKDGLNQSPISRNWSSLENNYVPFEKSEFSSINTVYNANCEEDVHSSTPTPKCEENDAAPAINVIQTDISVHKITVNTNNEVLDENSETSDTQLLQVLRALPDMYAKQIIELIESQKGVKSGNLEKDNNRKGSESPKKFDNSLKNDNNDVFQDSTTSLSPSQSIYYSLASSDTVRPLSDCSIQLIDLDQSPEQNPNVIQYIDEEVRSVYVGRELFPNLDANTMNNKQEWAASVIGAHIKGYLTRRLLNTEKVQSLIETIKDALVCALQLHNAENIDESDVELHRRLINQVSVACYEFHDIFFSISVQEQMSIIATDRQRKLEKAKRPTSAPTVSRKASKSSSARSTPRQRVQSHSRSLTKV
ncbi:hypothetical protein NQ315_006158 [Exocentrus adspersus]|uniref:Uncharacterized protein n=1 Tax=Exocentrus adspersus TaxID=1586481 RepID=A0AAV8W077_9CUCU|nr:hypothetical protein NQ315_006158 [Exocentrus adspersus]